MLINTLVILCKKTLKFYVSNIHSKYDTHAALGKNNMKVIH